MVCVTLGVEGGLLVSQFSMQGRWGLSGTMANGDFLWDLCKRTCHTGYLLFSLWFAFMVVHVALQLNEATQLQLALRVVRLAALSLVNHVGLQPCPHGLY